MLDKMATLLGDDASPAYQFSVLFIVFYRLRNSLKPFLLLPGCQTSPEQIPLEGGDGFAKYYSQFTQGRVRICRASRRA